MYTEEEYERRGFPFRELLLKFILIIIIVFLLVWILSKIITPKTDNQKQKVENNVLSSELFSRKLEKMKIAAINYYTEEKLPKKIGKSDKMTLDEMIKKKLISKSNKNDNKYDSKKSYIKITKLNNEYLLKINLKTKAKEDHILVYLGHYSYCKTYICEKKESTDVDDNVEDISSTENIVETTNQENVNIQTNNNTQNIQDNNEIKNEINNTTDSKIEEDIIITPPTDTTTNNDNKTDTPTTQVTSPKTPNYLYEYKKTTLPVFSNWTKWSTWKKTSCNTLAIDCNDSSESCLKKLQRYNRQEQIGIYQKAYVKQKTSIVQTGSYKQKTCSNYNYVTINNTTYATAKDAAYNSVNNISSNTKATTGSWKYIGRYEYQNPPKDTISTHYEFVGANYSNCSTTCKTLPNYYYDKYQLVRTITKVSTTTTSTNKLSVTCGSYTTKTIPIYSTITTYDKAYRTEPLYGTVCYESTKTRTLKTRSKTYTKWSNYNDKTLLNDGWQYTGNKKKK